MVGGDSAHSHPGESLLDSGPQSTRSVRAWSIDTETEREQGITFDADHSNQQATTKGTELPPPFEIPATCGYA